jgi:2-dehydropantoate 2-reductase
MRKAFARRLALEIMTEVVHVARCEGVRLEKVAGTIDLDWLALRELNRKNSDLGLFARHAVLFSAGIRYRKLRSSMLAAIERGRPPAVDFLNGEVVERGERHGLAANVNRAAAEFVWQIARGERRPSHQSLKALYDRTR